MTQPVLLGGLFIGILSALPIISVGNCCCLWIVGGGVLTAYLAQQGESRSLGASRGAFLGFLAGVVGACVWLVAALALDVFIAPLQESMLELVRSNARDMPEDARRMLESLAGRGASPVRFLIGFVFQLFVGSGFAALGGVLGAAFFRRDVPPALGGPGLPPQPPPLPPQ